LQRGALVRIVGREIAAHQLKIEAIVVELHGRATPEAADADDAHPVVHQVDSASFASSRCDQILVKQDLGAGA